MRSSDPPPDEPLWLRATGYALLVATVLGAIETAKAMVVAPSVDPTFGWQRAILTNMSWWYLWVLLVPVVVWVSHQFNEKGRVQAGVAHGVASVVLSAVHIGAASVIIWDVSSRSFQTLGGQLRELLVGYGVSDLVTYWAMAAAYGAWIAHRRLTRSERERHALELEASRLEAAMTEARLAALRSELNPHFLFNTLNTVSSLARRGSGEEAVGVVSRLGRILRRTLEQGPEQEVPLEQEMELLELYLEIESIRYSDRLTTEVRLDPAARQALVPPLLLQPLAENAVQHGAAHVRGPVEVTVEALARGDRLEILVRDTGAGLPPPEMRREGVGLRNTRERLAALYGADARVELESLEGGGTLARVSLPLRLETARVLV